MRLRANSNAAFASFNLSEKPLSGQTRTGGELSGKLGQGQGPRLPKPISGSP